MARQLTFLKSKIHRATVTQSDLNYEGSITVDMDFLDAAGIHLYEQVDVLNINNGERFTTYTIEGERGSGVIGINGAAARLVQKDDLVIICAYVQIDEQDVSTHQPKVILMGPDNVIKSGE